MNSSLRPQIVTIKNRKGLAVSLSNYGARILSMNIKTGDNILNIHEYHTNHEDYEKEAWPVGATIGPYAGRIRHGKYTIDGVETTFKDHQSNYVLHSGPHGVHSRYWDILEEKEDTVVFQIGPHESEKQDYIIYVTFMVTNDNGLMIQFEAKSEHKIHINLTSHGYFNLSLLDDLSTHTFQINADQVTELDDQNIPTGNIHDVKDTHFDLREAKTINAALYDINYILNKSNNEMSLAAIAHAKDTGLSMHCYTTQPALQFYTQTLKAFCLETQHYPNTPHITHFPSTLLTPGQVYKEQCLYRLSHIDDQFSPFNT